MTLLAIIIGIGVICVIGLVVFFGFVSLAELIFQLGDE